MFTLSLIFFGFSWHYPDNNKWCSTLEDPQVLCDPHDGEPNLMRQSAQKKVAHTSHKVQLLIMHLYI